MGRTHKRKPGSRPYKSKTEEEVQQALEAIRNGCSITKAAAQFKIAKGTLFNKLKGRHGSHVGRPRIFSDAEEQSFVDHLLKISEWGFPFDTTDLRFLAKRYLEKQGRRVLQFKNNMPGDEWAWRFIKNHPQLTNRKCQNIKLSKAALCKEDVANYFNELKASLGVETDNPLTANCIFNYDETNLTDDPGSKKCIFKRGVKYAERVKDSSKSSTSVMFCGSATGEILPPYVVYKSTHLWHTWTEGGPRGTRYNRTQSGWFDQEVFTDWFLSSFIPSTRHLGQRVAVIGDNLSSHFTAEVLKAAEEHNVAFICIPPNSTHIAQPLDVAFYAPLKRAWRKILDEWKMKQRKKSQTITKEAFPGLLKQVCDVVAGVNGDEGRNLVSGFRKCGIFPFDSDQVLRRIPSLDSESNGSDETEVQSTVSTAVLEMLDRMRNNPGEKPRRKKRKLEVTPGKSISYEEVKDIVESKQQKSKQKPKCKRKINVVSDSDEDEAVDVVYDDNSDSDAYYEELMNAGNDDSSVDSDEQDADPNAEEPKDGDTEASSSMNPPAVDTFVKAKVIYDRDTKKQHEKILVGQVVAQAMEKVTISFMRSKGSGYVFPDEVDTLQLDVSAVLKVLKVDCYRRGLYKFR